MKQAKSWIDKVIEARKKMGENQTAFWGRFGVAQSGGSRYEREGRLDIPLRMIIQAWLDGTLDDEKLAKLRRRTG